MAGADDDITIISSRHGHTRSSLDVSAMSHYHVVRNRLLCHIIDLCKRLRLIPKVEDKPEPPPNGPHIDITATSLYVSIFRSSTPLRHAAPCI